MQRLMNDEDGVVDHDANKYDKAEHCEDIELLRCFGWVCHGDIVDNFEACKAAYDRERDTEHDDKRIDEALKERAHEQIGHRE